MILELKNTFIGKAVNKAQQTSFTSPCRLLKCRHKLRVCRV